MDIQRWLDETADAEAPPKLTHTPASGFSNRAENVRPVFKQQHARKGAKSDSSLLDPRPHSHSAPKESKSPSKESSREGAYSEASRPSHDNSIESESSQPYARKPRRKTRPERYQPKQPKERGQHVHQSRKDNSKRSRRRSKGTKDERTNSGVAQTFLAKNVSRDRLTLKPRESLGIFNKGRTSTAVRGRGLPDLVFSEMKFLQKEKTQPDAQPQQSAPKKKRRKKDHAHSKEGEISAFFTSVRPALPEKDGNVPTHRVQKEGGGAAVTGHREREPSTKSSTVVPTTEQPAKGSYLGFGGRGPRHESTSYVSWSESVHAPDTAFQYPKRPRATDQDQSRHFKHHQKCTNDSGVEPTGNHPASPSLNDTRRRGTSTERFRISSVPSQQRMSRSHSYPPRTSSPQKVNLVDRAAKFESTEPVVSPSSMPPRAPIRANTRPQYLESRARSRLDQPETARSAVENNSSSQQDHTESEAVVDDVERDTSSDLGRVIQECDHTVYEQPRAIESHERRPVHYPRDFRSNYSAGVSRRPSVRFAGVEMRSPRVPNFTEESIYDQQAQRERVPSQIILNEEHVLEWSYLDEHELAYQQDDLAYDEHDWDEQLEEPWFDEEEPEAAMVLEPRASVTVIQQSRPEDGVVAPGFWRPNRLY